MPRIEIEIEIAAKPEIVFDLARSIDLHEISTSETNEKAVAGVTSGLIGMGESVTWRAKHLGIYQQLTSKITAFDFPRTFTDEMTQGAFKRFKHDHFFKPISNGTRMIDVFDYTSPLGFLGRFVDWLFLEKYMRALLVKRNLIIKEFAENGDWKKVLKS